MKYLWILLLAGCGVEYKFVEQPVKPLYDEIETSQEGQKVIERAGKITQQPTKDTIKTQETSTIAHVATTKTELPQTVTQKQVVANAEIEKPPQRNSFSPAPLELQKIDSIKSDGKDYDVFIITDKISGRRFKGIELK